MTKFTDSSDLVAEIERYLGAVSFFRAIGHEPKWLAEEIEGARRAPVASGVDNEQTYPVPGVSR